MSYPNSVWSPTTKNAGDTIQPSHINDAQTEIVAIEAGLTQGTANLNSSNSTLANLSVLGGSTLATLQVTGGSTLTGNVHLGAALQVDGNSTIAGNLTVTGTLSATAIAAPFVRLTNSAKQDIANSAWTALNFDTEVVDGSGLHSTAVNSSRINLTSSGSWIVGASVSFNNNSSGARLARILTTDTNTQAYAGSPAVVGFASPVTITAGIYVTSTTDYVTVTVFQDSGSTGSVTAHTGFTPCAFWAQRTSG